MPTTDESIQENGIPEITMTLEAANEIPVPVDSTLTISGQAADAKAVGDRFDELEIGVEAMYPVGTIYMSTSSTAPDFGFGTWREILIPMTWGDAKNGSRNYVELTGNAASGGTVHFWLRTE